MVCNPVCVIKFNKIEFAVAWVLGATDPSSGTVSILEVIRGLGVLLRKGWRPLRTIVLASWDAEEVNTLCDIITIPLLLTDQIYTVRTYRKYRMGRGLC